MKKKLTLEAFRVKKFGFQINRGLCVFNISEVVRDTPFYELDFNVFLPDYQKNLQRGLVWTLLQKQQFIISLFKGMNFPPITLIKKNDIYQVIDGKQRLTTIFSFVNNEFPIEFEGENYWFDSLPDELKNEILRFWVIADVGYCYPDSPISDADKIRWFELINFTGTPQDENHLQNLKKHLEG